MVENNNNRNPQNPQDPKRKIVKVRINLSWLYQLLLVGIGWMLLGQKGCNRPKQYAGTQRSRGHIAHRGYPIVEQKFGYRYAKAEDGVG